MNTNRFKPKRSQVPQTERKQKNFGCSKGVQLKRHNLADEFCPAGRTLTSVTGRRADLRGSKIFKYNVTLSSLYGKASEWALRVRTKEPQQITDPLYYDRGIRQNTAVEEMKRPF